MAARATARARVGRKREKPELEKQPRARSSTNRPFEVDVLNMPSTARDTVVDDAVALAVADMSAPVSTLLFLAPVKCSQSTL